jgi:hypothetical protein
LSGSEIEGGEDGEEFGRDRDEYVDELEGSVGMVERKAARSDEDCITRGNSSTIVDGVIR